MSERKISRDELPEDYKQMMLTEQHHEHEIVMVGDSIRWKESPHVRDILELVSLNDLCPILMLIGHGKNSEAYRSLYRHMGYSLSGYWEIFYWDMNNEDVDLYEPPIVNAKQRITELEHKLKTDIKDAFLAGCKYADHPLRGMKSLNDLRVSAEEYANQLRNPEQEKE